MVIQAKCCWLAGGDVFYTKSWAVWRQFSCSVRIQRSTVTLMWASFIPNVKWRVCRKDKSRQVLTCHGWRQWYSIYWNPIWLLVYLPSVSISCNRPESLHQPFRCRAALSPVWCFFFFVTDILVILTCWPQSSDSFMRKMVSFSSRTWCQSRTSTISGDHRKTKTAKKPFSTRLLLLYNSKCWSITRTTW